MKKLTIFTIVFCSVLSVYSQTTFEEYNYLTKGLRIQQESGLDMKRGYELKALDNAGVDNKKVELLKLVRANSAKTAAYLIIFSNGITKEYICVPTKDSAPEIRELFFQQLSNNGFQSNRLSLISLVLSRNLCAE